jgi:hypothetical protein
MSFTADATARKGYRLDFKGGADKHWFYLQNCGFFNETTPFRSVFKVEKPVKMPDIDIIKLEKTLLK